MTGETVAGYSSSMANMQPNKKHNRKDRLIARDGRTCAICGKPIAAGHETLDHIVPKAEGGGNEIENLRLAHLECNQGRHK